VAIISKQAIPRSISDAVPRQRKETISVKAEGVRTEDRNADRHKYIHDGAEPTDTFRI